VSVGSGSAASGLIVVSIAYDYRQTRQQDKPRICTAYRLPPDVPEHVRVYWGLVIL
jgi:hypothetical protein